MAIDDIEYPQSPHEAFMADSERDIDSQTTVLLVLGTLARADLELVQTDLHSFRDEFPLPEVKEMGRLDTEEFVQRFSRRFDLRITDADEIDFRDYERRRAFLAEIGQQLYKNPSLENIGNLILLGLGHPQERIRAAAAISFIDIFKNVSIGVRALLRFERDAQTEIVQALAETALSRFAYPYSRRLPPLLPTQPQSPSGGVSQTTSLLVHGTFFGRVGTSFPTWWKPGSNFHTYIKTNHRPNLYSKPDAYAWSGGYNDQARTLAAMELRDWLKNRGFHGADVIAHSHGGNVAMEATQLGAELNKLVLLSCPNHMPHYAPEFSRIKEAISIQIKMDWVILTDKGRIHFNDPKNHRKNFAKVVYTARRHTRSKYLGKIWN